MGAAVLGDKRVSVLKSLFVVAFGAPDNSLGCHLVVQVVGLTDDVFLRDLAEVAGACREASRKNLRITG